MLLPYLALVRAESRCSSQWDFHLLEVNLKAVTGQPEPHHRQSVVVDASQAWKMWCAAGPEAVIRGSKSAMLSIGVKLKASRRHAKGCKCPAPRSIQTSRASSKPSTQRADGRDFVYVDSLAAVCCLISHSETATIGNAWLDSGHAPKHVSCPSHLGPRSVCCSHRCELNQRAFIVDQTRFLELQTCDAANSPRQPSVTA